MLPRKAMLELQKLAGDADPDAMVQFSGDENHLFFQLGDRLLLSRKLTGNFPDYERVLPKEQPHSVTLEREELRGAIERVAQFSDERSRAIRVRVGGGRSEDSFLGFRNRRERREHSGELTTGPPPRSDSTRNTCSIFCARCHDQQVTFLFKDPHSAGELRPGGEKARQLPLRDHADEDLNWQ